MLNHHLSATQSTQYGNRLSQIVNKEDVPPRWKGSPIEALINAHNFDEAIESASEPKLLIVSCIEYRFRPEVPSMYAYVIRTAGGRLTLDTGSEFALSYILAKGVRHIALIGHNDCGMTKVEQFKPKLTEALIQQGWETEKANSFIEEHSPRFQMGDEIDALKREFQNLKDQFKKVEIAPLFVSLASARLHIPNWYAPYIVRPSDAE